MQYVEKHGFYRNPDGCPWKHPKDQQGKEPVKDENTKNKHKHQQQQQWQQQSEWQWQAPKRSTSTGARSRQSSADPKKACAMFAKGQCQKGKACGLVHNGPCWWLRNKGYCEKGDKCLFPHRDLQGTLTVNVPTKPPKQADPRKEDGGKDTASAKAKAGPNK